MTEKWRKPTEAEIESIERGHEAMGRMARAGWFVVPNEKHPDVKREIAKLAESIYKRIEDEILEKFRA